MAARGTGRAVAAAAGVAQPPKALIERLNKRYDSLHREFEDAFWATKMGLKDSPVGTGEALSKSKTAYEGFLADPANLKEVQTAFEAFHEPQAMNNDAGLSFDQLKVKLGNRFTPSDLKQAVEDLQNDGHIYTTVDDMHFKGTGA